MSEEKRVENNFKFGLYLRGEKIYERIFSADIYNPVVRYSVDIRENIPSIISSIQEVLQSKNLTFKNQINNANTKEYYKHICNINKMHPIKLFVPQPYKDKDETKSKFQGKGTEFKFGVYINTNPIVERNFWVDDYNPESRFSNELTETLNDVVAYLKSYLKKSDVNHMWNDYDLINIYELTIQKVRDLSKEKRAEYLSRKNDLSFVEKIRMANIENYSNKKDYEQNLN